MSELRPLPIGALAARMLRELDERDAVFDLPRRRFFAPDERHDLSVRFHGKLAGTPLGPAAGPHSQMAQNLVLAWLGGCRILELKTVQVDDRLVIPRPCIDMQTVGFNVEWSQELRLEQSLEEYVKGALLIEMLARSGRVPSSDGIAPNGQGLGRTILDLSVGYDLAGIRSERVQAFLRGMLDCRAVADRLRRELPEELGELRDVEIPARLADTLTLSTFHGCPPGEIEAIVDFLLRELGLHVVVKLNPMLLGPRRCRELLSEVLGYRELRVPDGAFERDTRWEEMLGFVERLGATAEQRGLGFGVKLTNTLIVENHRGFFPPSEKQMYLSGPPLHVLAIELVRDFRRAFGDRFPISFSAGIERRNFPDAVALGLVPVTVCSDLLRPGGYGRASGYLDELRLRMDAVGAASVDELVLRSAGGAADLSAARLASTERYAAALLEDPRYRAEQNAKLPRKLGTQLSLLDCVACDKCVPVCPNDANFSYELEPGPVPIVFARRDGAGWSLREAGTLAIERGRQYASFADLCNDCGNCDVFCPEDGGPYLIKPRFFGSLDDWRRLAHLDGFHLSADALHGRFAGREVALRRLGTRSEYSGAGFRLELDERDPLGTLSGEGEREVDLTHLFLLLRLRDALERGDRLDWPTLLVTCGSQRRP